MTMRLKPNLRVTPRKAVGGALLQSDATTSHAPGLPSGSQVFFEQRRGFMLLEVMNLNVDATVDVTESITDALSLLRKSGTLLSNPQPIGVFDLSPARYAVIAFGCASCPKITCGREGCGTEFCYHCKQLWHPNQTCDAARQQRAQSLRLRTVRSSSLSYSQESGAAGGLAERPHGSTSPFSALVPRIYPI